MTHIQKVSTSRERSSVVGTVRATCLIGEFSSSGSGFSEEDDGSKLESPPLDIRGEVISWKDSSIVYDWKCSSKKMNRESPL